MYLCMHVCISFNTMPRPSPPFTCAFTFKVACSLPCLTQRITGPYLATTLRSLTLPNTSFHFTILQCTTPPGTPPQSLRCITLHCIAYIFTSWYPEAQKQHAGHASAFREAIKEPQQIAETSTTVWQKLKVASEGETSVLALFK